MSALHHSAAFFAYTSIVDTFPPKSTTYSMLTSGHIGPWPRYALPAIEDQTDFMGLEEREAFERDTNSARSNCSP